MMRDEFWYLVLLNKKIRESIYRVSGLGEQLNNLDMSNQILKEKNDKLKAELQTAKNKIAELEASVVKLTKPKRQYVRHKPLKKKQND